MSRLVSKGFTLIELVMTIILIAIISVAVIPKFFVTSDYQKQVYHDEVINVLRYARKVAIATGSLIQVNLTSNSITLLRRIEGSTCGVGTSFVAINDPVSNISGFSRSAPGSVTLTYASSWPIYFNGLGQMYQASNCLKISTATITVTDKPVITAYGETGFVE